MHDNAKVGDGCLQRTAIACTQLICAVRHETVERKDRRVIYALDTVIARCCTSIK